MLKIGWSTKDVSTDKQVILPGQFHMRVSSGALDPVTVNALALKGDDCVIFLSCDIVGIQPGILDKVRERVAEKNADIDTNKIIMNATHTHTGPLVRLGEGTGSWGNLEDLPHEGYDIVEPSEYSEFYIQNATDAILEAYEGAEEGSISYGYGYAVVGHQRRSVYFDDISKRNTDTRNATVVDGHAKMYGDPNDDMFSHFETGADHFANFLYTFDKDGALTGAIVNIPCPSQCSELEWMLSADYWSDVRRTIRGKHGNIHILAQCAAAGDLSPRTLHYKKARDRRYRLKYADYQMDERVTYPTEIYNRLDIAERISEAFDEVYAWASKEKFNDLPIVHSVKTIELDRRLISDEEYQHSFEADEKISKVAPFDLEEKDKEIRLWRNSEKVSITNRFKGVLKRYEEQKTEKKIPMEMHIIKVGDIAFATNQFEYFMDYQHRIQARSPFEQTFIVQLCAQPGDRRAGSYLATERGVENRGYGAAIFDNLVSPEGGQQIVEETLEELKKIY